MLLAATDAGIARIEVGNGALQQTREFPDTEPFVDAASQLLVGKDGVYVVGRSEITALTNALTTNRRSTMTAHRPLPLPPAFDAKNAERYEYAPDQQRLFADAAEWRKTHGMTPAATDKRNIHLLLIDVQKDFCFPTGSLYVGGRSGRGAIDDSRRIAEFVYRNLNVLTNITTTMDTHFAYQIFFPSFWVDKDDKPLAPFREITTDDIDRGEVRPNPAVASWLCNGNYPWLLKQVRFYCAELEKAGKYRLYLWPPHCLLGSDGHALVGVLHEARLFHSFARGAQSWVEVKGGNPLTENYSVLRPEVLMRHDGQPLGAAEHAVHQDAAHGRRRRHRRAGRQPLREELDRRPARRDRGARTRSSRARSTSSPTACRRSPCPTARAASSPTSRRRPRRRSDASRTPACTSSAPPIRSKRGLEFS